MVGVELEEYGTTLLRIEKTSWEDEERLFVWRGEGPIKR